MHEYMRYFAHEMLIPQQTKKKLPKKTRTTDDHHHRSSPYPIPFVIIASYDDLLLNTLAAKPHN
jgi:hypothetical protein